MRNAIEMWQIFFGAPSWSREGSGLPLRKRDLFSGRRAEGAQRRCFSGKKYLERITNPGKKGRMYKIDGKVLPGKASFREERARGGGGEKRIVHKKRMKGGPILQAPLKNSTGGPRGTAFKKKGRFPKKM